MRRRRFTALATAALLAGCTTTDDREPDGSTPSGSEEPGDIAGLDADGFDDLDAFLEANQAEFEQLSQTLELSIVAAETFEDGFERNESRVRYDPSEKRLYFHRWWEYPDGDRSGTTEVFSDGTTAGERTTSGPDTDRLDRLSVSAAKERYTSYRNDIWDLLSMVDFGAVETVSDRTDAHYQLPVEGVRDDEPITAIDTGELLLTESGLIQSLSLNGVVEQLEGELRYDLEFTVTGLGDTSVDEPEWFAELPAEDSGEETDGDDGDGGDGGDGSSYDEQVNVGPGGKFVFDPEDLVVEPGTTVGFVWDSDVHNMVVESGPDEWEGHESIEDTGFSYEHTFEEEGTYEYICEPHVAAGMVGTITVNSEGESEQDGDGGDGGDGSVYEYDGQVTVGPGGELVFDPEALVIGPGRTVEFVWDSDAHNLVVESAPDEWEGHEPIEDSGFRYEHTFEEEGTYKYICEPHVAAGMEGIITVQR